MRVFRIIGVEIDAEFLECILRERRSRLRNADEVPIEHALHLHAVEIKIDESKVGNGARTRNGAARYRCVGTDAGRHRRQVHHAARVAWQALDLLLEHGCRHREPLHLHRFHALLRHPHSLQLHGPWLEPKTEASALAEDELHLVGRRAKSDVAGGDDVAARRQSEETELTVRSRERAPGLVPGRVDRRDLGILDRLAGIVDDNAFQRNRRLRPQHGRKAEHRNQRGEWKDRATSHEWLLSRDERRPLGGEWHT